MSKVAVLSTGGTIAMRVAPGQPGATLNAGFDMLAMLGETHQGLAITQHDLFSKPSASVSLTDVQTIADAVHRELENGCSGVVVTHGTDTIEETVFALSLLMTRDDPVVLTGAMRSSEQPGADGPANLGSAILVAASAQAQGLGPALLFGDELHAPDLVRKVHSSRPNAFSSAPFGPIGHIVEGRLDLRMKPATWRPAWRVGGHVPAVPVIQAGLDLEPEVIAAFDNAEIGALVIAGVGGGHVSARAMAAIAQLAARLPVIITTRTGMGHTLTQTYGYAGSEIDLARHGVLNGGRWRPSQARIIAQIILSNGGSAAHLAETLGRQDT